MSTAALPVHVALVDDTASIVRWRLAMIAGALSEQIQHDFAPTWHVSASVGVYDIAPAGCWAIHIQEKLDEPGALGYHTDDHNQPVAYVALTDEVSITISHELLEMLADPWGNRMHGARLPEALSERYSEFGLPHPHTHVGYLLEVCDPCEATSYEVGGVALSDFLTPYWYRSFPPFWAGVSYAGACMQPREIADGGYVSFANRETGEWYQVFNEGHLLQVQAIGQFDRSQHGSLREFTDANARFHRGGL